MTPTEAHRIAGSKNHRILKTMAAALSIHSWNNTDEEWERCDALRTLGYRAPRRLKDRDIADGGIHRIV